MLYLRRAAPGSSDEVRPDFTLVIQTPTWTIRRKNDSALSGSRLRKFFDSTAHSRYCRRGIFIAISWNRIKRLFKKNKPVEPDNDEDDEQPGT
jgi:hypothetical protein